MENRLELNKRPTYELPDEVLVGLYMKNYQDVDFNPDLCINAWGDILGAKTCGKQKAKEIWIKTDNKDLIDFISNFDWYSVCPNSLNSPELSLWKFKKILLEEFYGGCNGE